MGEDQFENTHEDGKEKQENRKSIERSVISGEKNLSIYESFFRRIFPGVYYKNPFTFALVTMNGYFPIGVKVSYLLHR